MSFSLLKLSTLAADRPQVNFYARQLGELKLHCQFVVKTSAVLPNLSTESFPQKYIHDCLLD
jgi:hypothetical protein